MIRRLAGWYTPLVLPVLAFPTSCKACQTFKNTARSLRRGRTHFGW